MRARKVLLAVAAALGVVLVTAAAFTIEATVSPGPTPRLGDVVTVTPAGVTPPPASQALPVAPPQPAPPLVTPSSKPGASPVTAPVPPSVWDEDDHDADDLHDPDDDPDDLDGD